MNPVHRAQLQRALQDFARVSALAGHPVLLEDLQVEWLEAPHMPPSRLPSGRMAVFCFWSGRRWLIVAHAAASKPSSYTFKQYNISATSLAGKLANDPQRLHQFAVAQWIQHACSRVNILLPATKPEELLQLLKTFLQLRLMPLYPA